jgi:hypothetical protein
MSHSNSSIISKIKELIHEHRRVTESDSDPISSRAHAWAAQLLDAALLDPSTNDRQDRPVPEKTDLPPELIRQLSSAKPRKKDLLADRVCMVLAESKRVLRIDDLLVEIWKRWDEVTPRDLLTRKLWTLSSRRLVYPVPGIQGGYVASQVSVSVDADGIVTVSFDNGNAETFRTRGLRKATDHDS